MDSPLYAEYQASKFDVSVLRMPNMRYRFFVTPGFRAFLAFNDCYTKLVPLVQIASANRSLNPIFNCFLAQTIALTMVLPIVHTNDFSALIIVAADPKVALTIFCYSKKTKFRGLEYNIYFIVYKLI